MAFIITTYDKENGIFYKNTNPHIYELGKKKYFIKNEVKNCLLKSFDLYKEFNLNLNYDILKENIFNEVINKLLLVYDNLIYYISKNIYNVFLNSKIYINLFGIKFKSEKSVKYNEIEKFINKIIFVITFKIETDKDLWKGSINKENISGFLSNILSSLEYLDVPISDVDIIEFNIKEVKDTYYKDTYTISFPTYFSIKVFDKNINNENNKKIMIRKSMEKDIIYTNNLTSETKILNNNRTIKIKEYKNFTKMNNRKKISNLKSISDSINDYYRSSLIKHLLVNFDYIDNKLLIKLENSETDWKDYKKEVNIDNISDIYKSYKNVFKNINKTFNIIESYKNQSMRENYLFNKKIIATIEKEIINFKNEINRLKSDFDLIDIL